MKFPQSSTHSSSNKGFALVATISLLAIILLVALAFLQLSTTTTRDSTHSGHMITAQTNARMALIKALGTLQKHMGPDQKISAPASIYDAFAHDHTTTKSFFHPTSGAISSSGVEIKHPNWVGVFDNDVAADSTAAITPMGATTYFRRYSNSTSRFNRWLVSGRMEGASTTSSTNPEYRPAAFLNYTDTDFVTLVGKGTIGQDITDTDHRIVRAPIEMVQSGQTNGAFAWWAGDNSTKATLNHQQPNTPTTDTEKLSLLHSGGKSDASAITGLNWLDMSLPADQTHIDRSFTRNTIEVHANSPAPALPTSARHYFHDYCLFNRSPLVNSREGGLLMDTTRLYAHDSLPYSFASPTRTISALLKNMTLSTREDQHSLYEKLISKNVGGSGGRSFAPLSFDINQIKEKINPGGNYDNRNLLATDREKTATHERLHSYTKLARYIKWDGTTPYLEYSASDWDKLRALDCRHPLPLVSRIQLFVSASMDVHNNLSYVIEPVVTMWNPYNIEVRIDPTAKFQLRTWFPALSFRATDSAGNRVDPWGALSEHSQDLRTNARWGFAGWNGPNNNMRFNFNGVTLKPGETKVLSDGAAAPNQWAKNHVNGSFGQNLNADFGWRATGGHLGSGCTSSWDTTGDWGKVPANETLEIQVKPTGAFYGTLLTGSWEKGWARKKHLFHQLDLVPPGGGLHTDRALRNIQQFMAYHQTTAEMLKIWGLDDPATPAVEADRIIRTGVDTNTLIAGEKIPICMIDTALRTKEDGSRQTLPYLLTSQIDGDTLLPDRTTSQSASSYWDSKLKIVTSFDSQGVEIDAGTNRGYFGPGVTAATGTPFYTAREIPVVEPLSLASYRNADILFPSQTYNAAWINAQYSKYWSLTSTAPWYGLGTGMQQVIGNSFAHPAVLRDSLCYTLDNPDVFSPTVMLKVHHLDHSSIINDNLYNNYFVSGLSNQSFLDPDDEKGSIIAILQGTEKAENSRLIPYNYGDPDKAADDILDLETGYLATAKYFVWDGKFNVNSTSVEAWKAVLRGLRSAEVPYQDPDGAASLSVTGIDTPFPKVSRPNGETINTTHATGAQERWNGAVKLTDAQITTLAENIVEQVKKRGPFYDLGDFVTRTRGTAGDSYWIQRYTPNSEKSDLSLCGAIQQAIDDSGINDPISADKNTPADIANANYAYPDAALRARNTGAPTFLTQGDILQAIGNNLTTRGDTFTIRCYGDSRDADGNIMATAYIEAVVTRSINYVNTQDTIDETAATLLPDSLAFGRKFRVVSVRWLSENEI